MQITKRPAKATNDIVTLEAPKFSVLTRVETTERENQKKPLFPKWTYNPRYNIFHSSFVFLFSLLQIKYAQWELKNTQFGFDIMVRLYIYLLSLTTILWVKKRPKRQFKGVRAAQQRTTNYILCFKTRELRQSECVAQISLVEFLFYTCTKTGRNNDNFNCFILSRLTKRVQWFYTLNV